MYCYYKTNCGIVCKITIPCVFRICILFLVVSLVISSSIRPSTVTSVELQPDNTIPQINAGIKNFHFFVQIPIIFFWIRRVSEPPVTHSKKSEQISFSEKYCFGVKPHNDLKSLMKCDWSKYPLLYDKSIISKFMFCCFWKIAYWKRMIFRNCFGLMPTYPVKILSNCLRHKHASEAIWLILMFPCVCLIKSTIWVILRNSKSAKLFFKKFKRYVSTIFTLWWNVCASPITSSISRLDCTLITDCNGTFWLQISCNGNYRVGGTGLFPVPTSHTTVRTVRYTAVLYLRWNFT